jgi:hypothetical protein
MRSRSARPKRDGDGQRHPALGGGYHGAAGSQAPLPIAALAATPAAETALTSSPPEAIQPNSPRMHEVIVDAYQRLDVIAAPGQQPHNRPRTSRG